MATQKPLVYLFTSHEQHPEPHTPKRGEVNEGEETRTPRRPSLWKKKTARKPFPFLKKYPSDKEKGISEVYNYIRPGL